VSRVPRVTRDDIARVFIQVNVRLKIACANRTEARTGRACVRVEEQAMEGKDPKWRHVVIT